MEWFYYKGYDQHGSTISGQIEASSKQDALNSLQTQHIIVADIRPLVDEKKFSFSFNKKLSLADLELLTSELSILLENGVKIDKGLDIIAKSASKPTMSIMLRKISNNLKKGGSLSAALEEHDEVFDKLYINLVKLGEVSGTLPTIFKRLSDDLKFRQDLSQKIAQATIYPMVILFVCVSSLFFVFNFIVPRMGTLFTDIPDLPWYTAALLGVSDWVNSYQYYLLVLIFALVGVFSWAWKIKEYKNKIKKRVMGLPGIKAISILIERIRFNSGLTMMLEAGVPIDKAIQLCVGNLTDPHILREMEIASKKINSGGKLSDTLSETSLYPDFFVALLQVGEETASLPSVFDEITKRSRAKFEATTQKITALLEPALILFMGGVVGTVVVIMLLSMVSVNDIAF